MINKKYSAIAVYKANMKKNCKRVREEKSLYKTE